MSETLRLYLWVLGIAGLITAVFFAADKRRSAKAAASRIPEMALLTLTGLGGAAGGLAGLYLFRHKTNFKTKFHFSITVWLSTVVQAAILLLLILKG
jgi:uncharacterized membrane protein YsdA (DUF1294 family)